MKKEQKKWQCITSCGSCCRLAPEERIDAIKALTDKKLSEYFELVGPDGWCKNYDQAKRVCKVYDNRPDFCKVENLPTIFNCSSTDKELMAIQFCKQHIKSVYGGRSLEMKRFNKSLKKN